MTPDPNQTPEKMKSVKAANDKAPTGPKNNAAAEKAHSAKNDGEANKELHAATHALE